MVYVNLGITMAISGIGSGRFVPLDTPIKYEIRDKVEARGNKTLFTYDCRSRKEDPSVIVKWLRRNFGDRGNGWNFFLNQGTVVIEIWDDKLKVMYEMWHR